MKIKLEEQEKSRKFYNDTYHASPPERPHVSNHLRRLAKKLKVTPDQKILDIACGTGKLATSCCCSLEQSHPE